MRNNTELDLGAIEHERNQAARDLMAMGLNPTDNFDTVTNPSIQCQEVQDRDNTTYNQRDAETEEIQQPQKKGDVLIVGFDQKPKGKNPLTKRKTGLTDFSKADRLSNKLIDKRNFNSNSDQKAHVSNKRGTLEFIKQKDSHKQTIKSKEYGTNSTNNLNIKSMASLSARGARDGNPSDMLSPRIMYAQKYQKRGHNKLDSNVNNIMVMQSSSRDFEDWSDNFRPSEK